VSVGFALGSVHGDIGSAGNFDIVFTVNGVDGNTDTASDSNTIPVIS